MTFHSKSLDYDENTLLVVALCKVFNVQLREIVNYIRQIKAASDFIEGKVHFFCLAILVFARAKGTDFYRQLLTEECGVPLRKFCPAGGHWKFHMNTDLVPVNDLVVFHVQMLMGLNMKFDSYTADWKKKVYNDYEQKPKLSQYKPVVDLAHQLS